MLQWRTTLPMGSKANGTRALEGSFAAPGVFTYSPLGLHISKSVLTTREGAVTVGFTALGA